MSDYLRSQLNNYQQKYQAWLLWNSQSSLYKLNNPEPPKPTEGKK